MSAVTLTQKGEHVWHVDTPRGKISYCDDPMVGDVMVDEDMGVLFSCRDLMAYTFTADDMREYLELKELKNSMMRALQ